MLKISLTSLTLDCRETGPSLGLLYSLLRSSIEHHSLRALHLPYLPQTLPPDVLRPLRTLDPGQETATPSSFSDIIRLLQPTLMTLSLGSQRTDVSGSPQPFGQQERGEAFLARFGGAGGLHAEPLDLSEAAPQLETLVCTSYPLDALIFGSGRNLSSSTQSSLSPLLSEASIPPSNPMSTTTRPRPRIGRAFGHMTTRLPRNLKRLEVRLRDKLLRTRADVWTIIADNILIALAAGDDEVEKLQIESVLLELPDDLLHAMGERLVAPGTVTAVATDAQVEKVHNVPEWGEWKSSPSAQKQKQKNRCLDFRFVERAEALKAYCDSKHIKVQFVPAAVA